MCRDWKREKSNHHFPELNQKRSIFKAVCRLLTPTRVSLAVTALTFIVGLTYLMQTNAAATKGYQIKELEQRISQLREENGKLNLQYIELQSMAKVIEQVPQLGLVATENIEVITPVGSAVALR